MPRTFYTIDDLAAFCQQNNFSHFSAKEFGNKPLIVQSIENFEVSDTSKDGLMPVILKSCHIGVNRNQSSISEDVMRKEMSSFKGRPILANIIKTDTGEYEFSSHDIEINEYDEIEYLEHPVGVISQLDEPYLEYDKNEDKTYLYVNGHIFTEYSRAAEILERRRTCKCSVEIAVNEMSWNCEENYLSIDAFTFMGVTILGYKQDGITEIQEGMKGSKITIDNFNESNSMLGINYQEKMIEVLDKLNMTLSNFNITSKEGGECMNDVEKIVANEEEEIVTEDIIVNESEDEDVIQTEEIAEETSTSDDGEELTEEDVVENFILQYELSHDDIRSALYSLLSTESEDEYYYNWIIEVYDNKFIYQNYTDGKFYRRGYERDGDNVSLNDNTTEVFSEWLSKEEKDALEALKADYSALKEFKENYESTQLKAQKDEVLAKEEYACLAETEAFKQLIVDAANYSVEELTIKADLLFAAHVKSTGEFSKKPEKTNSMVFNVSTADKVSKKPYGNLFD